MAGVVVDGFEVIQIDIKHRQRLVRPVGQLQRLSKQHINISFVAKAGQWVVIGHVQRFGFGFAQAPDKQHDHGTEDQQILQHGLHSTKYKALLPPVRQPPQIQRHDQAPVQRQQADYHNDAGFQPLRQPDPAAIYRHGQ